MDWKNWLVDHLIEIIALIVSIISMSYLIKINLNQKISLKNSDNNIIIQNANISSKDLKSFEKKFEENDKYNILRESLDYKEDITIKEQIRKIRQYLEENKSISTIAHMCLSLAKKLDMKDDITWLETEINGFDKETDSKGIEIMDMVGKEFKDYRKIEFNLYIKAKNSFQPEKFTLPMFLSQPINNIEMWAEQNLPNRELTLKAAPLKMMIDTLHISPYDKIPYNVNSNSIKNIITEFKKELFYFIDKAEDVLKKRR